MILKTCCAFFGGALAFFIGDVNGLLYALLAFIVIDYLTGVINAIIKKELSSAIGFKGLFGKICIMVLVGVTNILDMHVTNTPGVLKTAAIMFYIANEGISILENIGSIGVPIPEKIKKVLKQIEVKDDE